MWSKSNPHFHYELEHNPPHVMIWAGVIADHLIGPNFFDRSINQESYAEMINDWLIPELNRLKIKDRGSASFPSPISWPPRSPDLSEFQNFRFISFLIQSGTRITIDKLYAKLRPMQIKT
jgi:hypothetical protein